MTLYLIQMLLLDTAGIINFVIEIIMLAHIIRRLKVINEADTREYLTNYIRLKESVHCLLCQGYGHDCSQCTTKKRIDKLTKKTPMRALWGQLKSQQKMNFMEVKADVAVSIRARTHARNKATGLAANLKKEQEEAKAKAERDRSNSGGTQREAMTVEPNFP